MRKILTEPTMTTLLEIFKQDIFSTLNCHTIGTIESFDEIHQTAKIAIVYSKFSANDSSVVKGKDYQPLVDCPVIVMGGGKGSLRFPIKKGDTCLVLFNDRDMDTWFTSGTTGSLLPSDRKHNISDGIAIVGLRSNANALTDYEATKTQLVHDKSVVSLEDDRALLEYDSTKITLKEKVKIQNATQNLYTILAGVIDVLSALTTTNCVVGNPVAISPAQATQLTTYKTNLTALME